MLLEAIIKYLKHYFLFVLLPAALYLFLFIGYYYITQPSLFMFSYCPPGVLYCGDLTTGSGLFSGDFIIPQLSYAEGIERENRYNNYSGWITLCLFLIVVIAYFNYEEQIKKFLRRVKDEE
jgi:hypothetical protein